MERLHVVGASGAGTSTLGRTVAQRFGCAFFDTDDFYWLPTEPPYREPRAVTLRQELLGDELLRHERWVLSGSLCGWGDRFAPLFQMVVFLSTPTPLRLVRLREREHTRYGAERLAPGGDLHDAHEAFIAWAAQYDDGGRDIRSRARHEAWLETLPPTCRVLRLDGSRPLDALVEDVARR